MLSHRALRSLLFVPGTRTNLLPKALASGADAIILDLEDSVPPAQKEEARTLVAAELARAPERLTFLRISNPRLGDLDKDLAVLAPHSAQAVMVPKVEGTRDIEEIDARLAAHELDAGLDAGAISIVVVIESSMGLRHLFDTVSHTKRVRGAALATAEESDFMCDIGGKWTATGEALTYARGKFVCEARAAKMTWLIDGAFMQLADEPALECESRLARTHGFNGKVAVHPRQVKAINQVFSPTDAEVERAQKLIDAFRGAESQGRGAIQFEGMMVDYANVRWAEQILSVKRP
ncbi:MAG: citrate lyase subunit beta / citryl-CoA lyase [Gammaproteobacteria bacterium]|nr:citrate lyase subunit beta / citryl-CoA lyase [Gammaproteobacteria bacterium]